MKFDMGETHDERAVRLDLWHRSFAILPVRIADHDYRWLEFVWRRYDNWRRDWGYAADGTSLSALCHRDAEHTVDRLLSLGNMPHDPEAGWATKG